MKVKLSILLLFLSVTLYAQSAYDSTKKLQTVDTYGNNNKNGRFRGSLNIPTDTIKMAVKDSGAIVFKSSNIYLWDGHKWVRGGINVLPYSLTKNATRDSIILSDGIYRYAVKDSAGGGGSSVDTTFLRRDINLNTAQVTANTAAIQQRVRYTDTASMLFPYTLKTKTQSDSTTLAASSSLKLNISDTASMFFPYLRTGTISWPAALFVTPSTGVVASHNITFSPALASQSAYTLFGCGSVTGVPIFLTSIDSNWVAGLHSEAYFNTKYAEFGSGGGAGARWNLTGNAISFGDFLGTTNNTSLRFRTNNAERFVIDSVGDLNVKGGRLNFGDYGGNNRILLYDGGISGNRIGLGFTNGIGLNLFTYNGNKIVFGNVDAESLSGPTTNYFNTGSGGIWKFSSAVIDNILSVNGSFSIDPPTLGKNIHINGADGNQILLYDGGSADTRMGMSFTQSVGTQIFSGYSNTLMFGINKDQSTLTAANAEMKLFSDGRFVVGQGSTGNTSAIGEYISTIKGFLTPRMTTAQRNAIASPADGLQVYDTDIHNMCFYMSGTGWRQTTSTAAP